MAKKTSTTIQVVTQLERLISPKSLDISVVSGRRDLPDLEDPGLQSLLAGLQGQGIGISRTLDRQGSPGERADHSGEIIFTKIPFASVISVLDSLEGQLNLQDSGFRWSLSIPEVDPDIVEEVRYLSELQFAEIASPLMVRKVAVEEEELSAALGEPGGVGFQQLYSSLIGSPQLPARITLRRRYRTTRFFPLLYNAKLLLENFNLDLIKKQLRFSRFQRRFTRTSSSAESPAGLSGPGTARPRAVVFGHFSFPGGGGTFGDLEAMELVRDWLDDLSLEYDVVTNHEDGAEGIDLSEVRPEAYGIFIFVCGPWYADGKIHAELLKRFQHSLKIGVNLTTFEEGKAGFDLLLSRDNLVERNADIAFGKKVADLPVAGILLIERQKAYGFQQRHQYVKQVVLKYLEDATLAPVWLDTNAAFNQMRIRTAEQFESIVRRTDFVITDRLHGLVLSLKNAVPVIAIDPVEGGGKITSQAEALDWPILIPGEEFTLEKLHQAVVSLQGDDFSAALEHSRALAEQSIQQTRDAFSEALEDFRSGSTPDAKA